MSIHKIVGIIIVVWLIYKVKRFIFRIKIKSKQSLKHQPTNSTKSSMDIQEADYEDME